VAQGVVARIFDRTFGSDIVYSFTLKGDQTFYRLGSTPPTFAEGDSIRFETSQKGKNTYANRVVPWKEDGIRPGASNSAASVVARASGAGPRTADEFWRNKELRDVQTQQRIELQSCRNSAIELVRLLLGPGVEAVKLPAAQAKKEQVVFEMVQKYTADFLAQNKSGGPTRPEEQADPVPDSAEPAVKQDKVDQFESDNWN
jgi:hypothetical protein